MLIFYLHNQGTFIFIIAHNQYFMRFDYFNVDITVSGKNINRSLLLENVFQKLRDGWYYWKLMSIYINVIINLKK